MRQWRGNVPARQCIAQILVVAKHRRYKSTFARLIDRVKCCDGFEMLQQRLLVLTSSSSTEQGL